MTKISKSEELLERCTVFAEKVLDLLRKLPDSSINHRLIEQCSGSAGSIGANYCEATEAESRKDFIHKVSISKKEIKETRFWLRLLGHSNPKYVQDFRDCWKESQELLLIFSTIVRTAKNDP